jgi:hypothetical protein
LNASLRKNDETLFSPLDVIHISLLCPILEAHFVTHFLANFVVNLRFQVLNRVARFFLIQHTKAGQNIPNGHKIWQMAVKYTKWT